MKLFRLLPAGLACVAGACLQMSVSIAATAPADAKSTDAPAPPATGGDKTRVRVECRMVIVPQEDMLALLPDLREAEKIEGAWQRLEQMIARGGATLVTDLLAQGNVGQRCTAEANEEMRYPSEFHGPELPSDIPSATAVELLKIWPHVGAVPYAFETRNVGTSLQVDAARVGEAIGLNLEIKHVRFLRWATYDAGRLANGERLGIDQPIFHSMADNATIWLRNGERVLLGVHRSPEPGKPAFELFLLRAALIPGPAK